MKDYIMKIYMLQRNSEGKFITFLKLEQKITIGQRGEQILFPLKVTNLGNSGALDVQIEFKASDELGFLYVDKCKRFDRTDYYLYTDVLYDNVLPVGYSGLF